MVDGLPAGSVSGTDLDLWVAHCVEHVEAIDVHTHLLPPTHGNLLLYGIDELLCYHYLVAELFMTLPIESELDTVYVEPSGRYPSADEFFSWPKPKQADLVFEELFVKRTPISEACRGVVTALNLLGLGHLLLAAARASDVAPGERLAPLRAWFAQQDPASYLEHVFTAARLRYNLFTEWLTAGGVGMARFPHHTPHRLRYAVMTNVPFAPEEAEHWPAPGLASVSRPCTPRLRSALRVDPILAGDWHTVTAALDRATPPGGGRYPPTIDGCVRYVADWVRAIQPIYLMASTPAGFTYSPTRPARNRPVSEAELTSKGSSAAAAEAGAETAPTAAQMLEGVVLQIAVEHRLPVALKVGAVRGANAALRTGGDGVEVADLSFLWRLCRDYPHVKFLATVLSSDNQHELCVMARKFGNLHIYGCWCRASLSCPDFLPRLPAPPPSPARRTRLLSASL
jgi:hypothetical protein